jgi:glycosyltransferase involved in cell wall biosynthesis
MAAYWQTEVLTTCALDYMTWENWYPEGVERVDGTIIRRFAVDRPRDVAAFNQLSSELDQRRSRATLDEQEGWMRAQGPISTPLLQYLNSEKDSYDAFIFFGYLYATTYFGLPLIREKSYLAPLAHDEWPIYFSMWDRLMTLPRAIIFSSPEEKLFFKKRFPRYQGDGPVIGIGLDSFPQLDASDFCRKYSVQEPFLLYAGRIDDSKGCGELLNWFIEMRKTERQVRRLVLIGREVLPVPYHRDIIYLGFVSENEKWAAMQACDWLLNPSIYESLSIALLEGWLAGRPALVNGKCDVLVGHCQRSNGGLWYNNFEEWSSAIKTIDQPTKATLGRQGREYVVANYSWERVERSYLDLLR